jgi:hypothetical protein
MMRVVSAISRQRMTRILSETLIESVDAVPTQMPSSAGLDSSWISVLACGFWWELILVVVPCLREYLVALYRKVTAVLSSESA